MSESNWMPSLVGLVADVDGPFAFVQHKDSATTYGPVKPLKRRMRIFLGDRITCAKGTTVCVEYLIGGRSIAGGGHFQNDVWVVHTPNDMWSEPPRPLSPVEKVNRAMDVMFCCGFDKPDKEFQIQTAGGASIEG